jgi:hypothetical protein
MFCKGKCDKCGLNYTITLHNVLLDKPEEVKRCAFMHMADSYMRLEQSMLQILQGIENSKNEKANADNKMSSVVATGFIGMMHAFNEDQTKFKNTLKLLSKEGQNGTIPDRIS